MLSRWACVSLWLVSSARAFLSTHLSLQDGIFDGHHGLEGANGALAADWLCEHGPDILRRIALDSFDDADVSGGAWGVTSSAS
jgi:hypothetical protein